MCLQNKTVTSELLTNYIITIEPPIVRLGLLTSLFSIVYTVYYNSIIYIDKDAWMPIKSVEHLVGTLI